MNIRFFTSVTLVISGVISLTICIIDGLVFQKLLPE